MWNSLYTSVNLDWYYQGLGKPTPWEPGSHGRKEKTNFLPTLYFLGQGSKSQVNMLPKPGNPYFTTDTAATLRAVEIKADVILKGTRVDGVYSADPEKDPTATRYTNLSFSEAISKGLKIMDTTAFTLCQENNLPIIVFDMNKDGNLTALVKGEKIGTLITS